MNDEPGFQKVVRSEMRRPDVPTPAFSVGIDPRLHAEVNAVLAWATDERSRMTDAAERLEKGQFRMLDRGSNDVSQEWAAQLRRRIAELDALLGPAAPASSC